MESKIRVLSEQTINQIAAGEVIENPASVVKELVENAIDADASDITVEITEGGRNLIRITDNGYGMNADDALLCLERHATSKITNVNDIQTIYTMGFRGEAIPSIASISKFSILTKQRDDDQTKMGTLVLVEGGRILKCCKAPRSSGTTIEAKSLFYNVPVRRKFQKSPTYDTNEIFKILSLISLGNPNLKFELISNEKKLLNCNASQDLKTRIKSILGSDFSESIFEVQGNLDGYEIRGFIGCPSMTRQNRTGQYLFINQRAVQSPLVSFSVRDGYGTTLPSNRHPIYVLHLTIPGELVDVNVHPQKREVRLRQEQTLKELIIKSVEKTLQHSSFAPQLDPFFTDISNPEPHFAKYQANSSNFSLSQKYQAIIDDTKDEEISEKKPFEQPYFSKYQPPTREVQPLLFKSEDVPLNIQILTTLPQYILIDPKSLKIDQKLISESLFCLIDQKAAHARIIFESLIKDHTIEVQHLLVPYTFETSAFEQEDAEEQLDFLIKMGIQIHQSGTKTFIVDSIPVFFRDTNIQTLVTDLMDQLKEFKSFKTIAHEKEKRLAFCASRAAISENKRLNIEEAKSLIDQLMKCEMPYQCPKGKQIFAYISKKDLENFF